MNARLARRNGQAAPASAADRHARNGGDPEYPHLCHIFPSFGTGGAEVRTSLLINATASAMRHTILSLDGRLTGRSKIRASNVAVFEDARDSRGVLALSRRLRALRPDLVLTYGWGATDALPAARAAGLPAVHIEDGFLPDEASRQKPHRQLARMLLLRLPAAVICPSMTLVRIARCSWRLPPSKIRYVPNGVDAREFRPGTTEEVARSRRWTGCRDGEFVVGTVGRLSIEKNPLRLLRAFAVLAATRPARLLMVGDGPLRDEVLRGATAIGLADRVTVTGWTDRTAEAYRAMDAFALTSDTEQMPIVLLEAMASGLPVAATAVGDVAEMVSAENRPHVHPAAREGALAESLLRLASSHGERLLVGEANRSRCEARYSIDRMLESHMDIFRVSIARPRP